MIIVLLVYWKAILVTNEPSKATCSIIVILEISFLKRKYVNF